MLVGVVAQQVVGIGNRYVEGGIVKCLVADIATQFGSVAILIGYGNSVELYQVWDNVNRVGA